LNRGFGGPHSRSARLQKREYLLSPLGFETRTVQPVAYLYTAHPNAAPRQAYTIQCGKLQDVVPILSHGNSNNFFVISNPII
jgi:hypothetical protein